MEDHNGIDIQEQIDSLTLRDFFAGCALMGMVSREPFDERLASAYAFTYADAMLNARETD